MSRQPAPRWLSRVVVDAIHADQIREHGGIPGVLAENALESARALPRQKWSNESETGFRALGAAYAFGLVRNHPYRDGNKRIGFLALVTFLELNGRVFEATDLEIVTTFLALADGSLSEESLGQWVADHLSST